MRAQKNAKTSVVTESVTDVIKDNFAEPANVRSPGQQLKELRKPTFPSNDRNALVCYSKPEWTYLWQVASASWLHRTTSLMPFQNSWQKVVQCTSQGHFSWSKPYRLCDGERARHILECQTRPNQAEMEKMSWPHRHAYEPKHNPITKILRLKLSGIVMGRTGHKTDICHCIKNKN